MSKTPPPITFGVWGLGRIGAAHCRYYSATPDMYELVAVCDLEAKRVDDTVAAYGCTGYRDAATFLADPDMELVIVATRSLDHAAHAEQALAAGKLVLLEKPIAVTDADVEQVRDLDRRYPGKLFFGHNVRFEAPMQRIFEIVASGVLGDIFLVRLRRHFPYRRRADWQSRTDCGGGQLSVWGPHIIDHALQFIGGPLKDLWSALRGVNSPGDADNHVKLILTGANGIVVDAEISDVIALPGALCSVHGHRGSLVCPRGGGPLQLRYVDPEYAFADLDASAGLPPQAGGYDSGEDIPWIEETVAIESEVGWQEHIEREIARHLFAAIREGIPFPIANADALAVARITSMIKHRHPEFNWIQ